MKIKELSVIAGEYQASELGELSPHGRGHVCRTAILAQAIQLHVGGDLQMIVAAALLHDIGRIDDKGDAMHGYRGVYYAIQAMMDPLWVNCVALNMAKKGMVTDIIIHHCEPGPGTFLEMQIVKDADKLDRVRFQGENILVSSVLDIQRLHFKEISIGMILEAQDLLRREEEWKV